MGCIGLMFYPLMCLGLIIASLWPLWLFVIMLKLLGCF